MHPDERVRWVVETARAVLDGRLGADDGVAAVTAQAGQLAGLLRSDRDMVTRSEAEAVATRLRLLAEQVNDAAPPGSTAHADLARAIGVLAASLR